jgi:succinate dehydrogenase/fumarate reductase flavoprotein subunit
MESEEAQCDVLVIGSGAGGLSAALTARLAGLEVVVAEKASSFGGTTALSGGWIWIPMSPHALAAGIADSAEEVLTYIEHEAGEHFNDKLAQAFIDAGPRMLRLFAEKTTVKFELGAAFPDYHPNAPGAKNGGRSLEPLPLDARELGGWLSKLAPPLRELSLAGMVIGSGTELKHFFNASRSAKSAWFVARRLVTHFFEVVRFGRGMRLVNGNALAARLVKSLVDLNVPLWLVSEAKELVVDGGRVTGALLVRNGRPVHVNARRGVVLACGGFPHDVERRKSLYHHPADREEHFPLAPPTNTGDGLRMARAVGARTKDDFPDAAAWTPTSRLTWPDGSVGIYPHFVDRGKPGVIAVDEHGLRFVNESNSYHDFIKGYIANRARGAERMYFVCDHRALSRFGLGVARPFPFPVRHWIRSGYLLRARTLRQLAARANIDPAGLEQTAKAFNEHAVRGEDPLFGRGSTAYNHFQGDALQRPNPCLAPLSMAPYYAVRIWPGDIGTFAGIVTNEHAQIMAGDKPVVGLYAVGNDMASVMGGTYPGAGITLGPALTFGYIAAMHIAGAMQEQAATRSEGLAYH